jgi:membrane-associated phospholipid phosphatase
MKLPARRLLHSILCILLSSSFAFALNNTATLTESTDQNSNNLKPLSIFTNLPGDYKFWGRETFTASNIPIIAGVLGSTVALVPSDHQTWKALDEPYRTNPNFKTVSDALTFMGDGIFQFGIAATFLSGGLLTHDEKALRTAEQITEAILATGILIQVLKHSTGRESPSNATTPTGQWSVFPDQQDYLHHVSSYDAMPSGHIATATTTLVVIQENYPNQKWISYIGYPLLAGIATSLVATSMHWWSDFPIGVALGYSFGKSVTRHNKLSPLRLRDSPTEVSHPEIVPEVGPAGEVLTFNWKW